MILFLSKEDGALLKAVPKAVNDAWSLSSVSLWNGGLVAVQFRTEGSIGDRVWHRRLVILDDEGKAKKVLMSWDDTSKDYNVMIGLDPIGNKIAFTENSVLKLIDLKSGEIEVIHEGDPSVSQGYQVLGSSKRYPNGVLYTVTEALDYEEPKNELGAVTGVRMTRQETLYYYQFADGKTYPLLQTTADYAFDLEKDLQTASGPLWDVAAGDLQKIILYGRVSGLFASIDLENGVLYTLDRTDDYYDSDFNYHYPRVFFRAQDGTIVVEGGREILVDDGYNTFSAYRVLNDYLYGEKYLNLNVADPDGQTAFYVDRSAGVAYLYDFSKSEPELTESEIEKRKKLLRSLDFSTPGDPFTEEEKEWIREYFSLVLLRADISGNDRIDDSVKAKWQTVTKLPYEKYNTECLFGNVRLLYDDGETAAVEYYVAFSSSYGPKGSVANLLLLKKVGGQWTTAGHAVEIWPELGPEVLEIGRAVREAAKKSHGAITEQEIEDGKRAAIEYIVNERIQDLSEEDKNAIRACLSAEYIPEIYDGVLETDLEFTMNGLLMIRPLPYFYVTVYADAENLPENVRNAISPCMYEYEGRYEKAFFVWYDTAFHASDPGSYVTKPIVLHGETEAFYKVRNAITYASDGELKYQVRTANGEMSGWKPLDFSKDRSASDGRTPVKVLLSNMQSSAQYPLNYGTKYLWIADQKGTWTLKLQDYSATIETDGHVYSYYVWANKSADQQFFMELQTVWEAEME